jgi:hypothetical protein
MKVDWDIVIKIIVPLGTLVLGKYLDRWLSKRPKLISYLGHSSAFIVRSTPPVNVHTHAIVVRNAGRATANQVRIGHYILPDNIQLYPSIPYTVERAQDGAAEIVIPKLVPDEQVTISYLYFPPLLWSQIHAYIKSDEGYAKILNVLPTPQLPKWTVRTIWAFIFIGVVSVIYLVIEFIRWLFI